MVPEILLGLAVLTVLVAGGGQAVLARKRRARPAMLALRPSIFRSVPLWSVTAQARRPLAPPSGKPRCWQEAAGAPLNGGKQ